MATTISTYQKANSTHCDLAYSILLALGGTMADVVEKYNNSLDDLLDAVLQKVSGGGIGGGSFETITHICDGSEGNSYKFATLANISIDKIAYIAIGGTIATDIITAGEPINADVLYTVDATGGTITVADDAAFVPGEKISVRFLTT